jgi:threonylcarbamoyladenosine tRNA methylthiotransferase MtaB
MRERLLEEGFSESLKAEPADVCLINTCTVTQKADSESLNLIRRSRRENPRAKVIVTGCLTELDRAKIKEVGGIDLIVKNKDKPRIINLLNGINGTNEINKNNERSGITYFKGHTRAFLKIQDGCDNYCSYCKVPLVRGRSQSKPLSEIIKEAGALVKNGFREIVLTGVCLGAYGRDLKRGLSLTDVIDALEPIRGLLRIRLSSIEASDVTLALIEKIANSNKLCRHLHIPIQSGDNSILKKMNRKYRRLDYLRLIKALRKRLPGIAITTDILVGFPGESENNFQNTVDLIKKIQPARTHIFPYSRREKTMASVSTWPQVDTRKLKARIIQLNRLASRYALKFKRESFGGEPEVLVEGRSKDFPSYWEGYTDTYIKMVFKGNKKNLKNRLVKVKPLKSSQELIHARLCSHGLR